MAKSRSYHPPPPLPREKYIPPAVSLLAALILLLLGYSGFAGALLFAGIGLWLHAIGKHRRWKGAPEVGYLLIGIGVVIVLVNLFRLV